MADLLKMRAELEKDSSRTSNQLAVLLNRKPTTVRYLMTFKSFDSEAIQKINQAAANHILSFSAARALALLKSDQKVFQEALDFVLTHQLPPLKIEALVAWISEGKAIADFDHAGVKRTRRGTKNGSKGGGKNRKTIIQPQELTNFETLLEFINPLNWFKSGGQEQTPSVPRPSFLTQWFAGINPLSGIKKKIKSGEKLTAGEDALLIGHDSEKAAGRVWKAVKPILHAVWRKYHGFAKWMANMIAPHPHSKGAGLNRPAEALWHQAVFLGVLGLPVWALLGFVPLVRHLIVYGLYRLARWLTVDFYSWSLDWVTRHWIQAAIGAAVGLVVLVFVPQGRRLITLVALAFGVWLWSFARDGGPSNPLASHVSQPQVEGQAFGVPISKPEIGASVSQPQVEGQAFGVPISKPEIGASASQPQVKAKNQHPLPIEKKITAQLALRSSESVGGPILDPQLVASVQEAVLAIPANRIIKAFPVEPDANIGQLMAINRVGDLAVESEYSLRVGQGGQKILSVTPSATGLTIVTAGGPLGSLLGGGSSIGFYWEDVLDIYCDELDTPSGKAYFFVLTATNLNQPLVVQCNTANNLNHLVSAFEYFIKSAQGKYVPVTGMPYLYQGMVLGDEGKVIDLWADSPADQAALRIGDHVWSISGDRQQTKDELEAELQALPSGKQTIEVVTPKDWDMEVEKENRLHSKQFHPSLSDFELVVP